MCAKRGMNCGREKRKEHTVVTTGDEERPFPQLRDYSNTIQSISCATIRGSFTKTECVDWVESSVSDLMQAWSPEFRSLEPMFKSQVWPIRDAVTENRVNKVDLRPLYTPTHMCTRITHTHKHGVSRSKREETFVWYEPPSWETLPSFWTHKCLQKLFYAHRELRRNTWANSLSSLGTYPVWKYFGGEPGKYIYSL